VKVFSCPDLTFLRANISTPAFAQTLKTHINDKRDASKTLHFHYVAGRYGSSAKPCATNCQMGGETERRSYYEGAIRALQFVEARRPTERRFGANADARWNSFKGDLETADRIDLLIRDADAEWPCSFGARSAFDLQSVATDEAFGSEWEPLLPVQAEELWRCILKESAPESPTTIINAIAKAWNAKLIPIKITTIAATDFLDQAVA